MQGMCAATTVIGLGRVGAVVGGFAVLLIVGLGFFRAGAVRPHSQDEVPLDHWQAPR